MMKLRTFARRHLLVVVFLAVAAPLLSILAIQYWSLRKLEKTSTVAETVGMKNYLADVHREVKRIYWSNAEQVLDVPASALAGDNLEGLKYPFARCEVVEARRLFLATFRPAGESQLLFFDSRDQTRVTDVPAGEARTASLAIAPLKLLSQEGTPVQQLMSVFDRDPENPLIYKAIVDEHSRVLGVAGMVIDSEHFARQSLPAVIRSTLPKYFPDEASDNVIVTVQNQRGEQLFSTLALKGQDDEISVGLPIFYGWKLGIRSRHMTPAQWAHWNFNFNLTLSLLMTAVLLSAIALALRTASREMRLSQMKTDFVSNVSHELRTPLASIRVFGEFLKLGRVRDDEKIREYGEYIETESRRLTQLINNILDFSKIESGRKLYQFERADVGDVICAALKTSEVQLRQQDFSVRFDAPRQPLPAVVDTDSIAQAFMNLLDNAVKYSGTAREIDVRLERHDGSLRISVTDFGVGIPREEQTRIFEKFYRVSTGLVHDVKGSGLGLALVEHIVKAHGGRVTVESEPGRGSTFTIHLPAAVEEEKHQETPAARNSSIGTDAPLGFGLKH